MDRSSATLDSETTELQREIDRLRADLRAWLATFDRPTTVLTGNHDPDVSPHHTLDLADGRVFVTHGDILFDSIVPWSRDAAEIGRLLSAGLAALPLTPIMRVDLRHATLNIDGESTPLGVAQIFRQLRAGDRRNGPKALNKVRFLDSKRTPCLQLADYLAGMSGRWHRKKTPIATRWLRSLEGSEQN